MKMYIQHYFNPDFNHLELRPSMDTKGRADRYNLGFVQNTIKGQVLAELVPLDTITDPNTRFIVDEPVFPAGPNTRIDPDHPQYILADANGYVFYYNNKISVKNLLNVRTDVDFHTGNIVFVGDMALHKDIKAGFAAQACNILVKGMVEGGVARAGKTVVVQGGAKGGPSNRCLVTAGETMRVSFAEKAELRSEGKLIIERFCMHSSLYAGGPLMVQGRLIGGTCQAHSLIYVRGELGNSSGVPTRIFLGYDPSKIRQLERCDSQLSALSERINHYAAVAGHLPPDTNELTHAFASARKKRSMLLAQRDTMWKSLHFDESTAAACQLIVAGVVHPGVEISIGRNYFHVNEELNNVAFFLDGDEIVVGPAPKKLGKA